MAECQTAGEFIGVGIGLDRSPKHLLAQHLTHEDGTGEPIELAELQGQPVGITLEIDHVVQQESLTISIWGSEDGADWGQHPLITLPQKHYCGAYFTALNLAKHPQIRFLRAAWKLNCWRKGCDMPLFGFTLSVEASGSGWKSRRDWNGIRSGEQGNDTAGLSALAEGLAAVD